MNIRRFISRLKARFPDLERGQALAEYMPTMAGAMAVTTIAFVFVGGGVKGTYCTVVDALGDRPDVCETTEITGNTGDTGDSGGSGGAGEEPIEATCRITLSSADGTDPNEWNTEWDGNDDILLVDVAEIDEPLTWSLKLRFPTDPNSTDTEISSGVISQNGSFEIVVPYPAKGEWGPVSPDGYGTYESHATLHITDPCGDVGWDRWYKADWSADLAIGITHDVSPVTVTGETLTYTVTVTNNGPNGAQVYENVGTVVNLPAPAGVTVLSATPSQGVCDTQIVCDLGEMPYLSSATITVVTTVTNPAICDLDGTATVSAPRPPDPNLANNQATTFPFCELTCAQNVTDLVLVDAKSDTVIGSITNGMQHVLAAGDEISILAQTSGSIGSVVFGVNGNSSYHTENVAPYVIAGDSSGNYTAWNVSPGDYTVTATAYTGKNGTGETCSAYTVNFTLVQEEQPDTPGGINDPNQPFGDPYATCPTSHPMRIAEFDHYATPENALLALQWGNPARQSKTHTFTLNDDFDTVLVVRGAVGHPENGCPADPKGKYCNLPNQDNEHWSVDVDGSFVAFMPDNYALDHVYMIYPDVHLGVVSQGTHELRMYHAGLLDLPSNSSKPSVGAYVAVCVSEVETY